jgi:hypothetical protein
MPAGRPKKTLADLPLNWEEIILEIKKNGGSDVEVRVALDISQDLWDRFKKEIEEFSLTVKRGTDLCEAWWLKRGRELENKQFNATLWYMNMKNRFGWKDKNETDITSGGEKIIPIYGGNSISLSRHPSDPKDILPDQENQSS